MYEVIDRRTGEKVYENKSRTNCDDWIFDMNDIHDYRFLYTHEVKENEEGQNKVEFKHTRTWKNHKITTSLEEKTIQEMMKDFKTPEAIEYVANGNFALLSSLNHLHDTMTGNFSTLDIKLNSDNDLSALTLVNQMFMNLDYVSHEHMRKFNEMSEFSKVLNYIIENDTDESDNLSNLESVLEQTDLVVNYPFNNNDFFIKDNIICITDDAMHKMVRHITGHLGWSNDPSDTMLVSSSIRYIMMCLSVDKHTLISGNLYTSRDSYKKVIGEDYEVLEILLQSKEQKILNDIKESAKAAIALYTYPIIIGLHIMNVKLYMGKNNLVL